MKSLKIAMIASECAPFAKAGGLADVVAALSKTLHRLGHQVIVVLPKYADLDTRGYELKPSISPLGVWMGDTQEWSAAYQVELNSVPIYLIESHKYFDRFGLYHDADFYDYLDNPRRFGFFTRAALQLCHDMGFEADIVHAHDWQAALAPAYLKIWHWDDPVLGRAKSVLTIHNMAYQGVYNAAHYDYLGLQQGNFVPDKFEDHGQINFLKGGISYADWVNTVSPKYAAETRNSHYAFGLAPYLNSKGERYSGILNGADYDEWDPANDALIPARYATNNLADKMVCKRALQERFGLEANLDIPLLATIGRFVPQKGLDLLAQTIDNILTDMRVQFVVLGAGEKALERFYRELPGRYPGRAGSYIGYNNELSHWIEAGADFFLMPSRYEPCGLNQIYSLRYGALPIVRATGGLDDTIQQYDETSGAGTGFKFWEPSPQAIYYATGWAVSTYFDRPMHMVKMIRTAMKQDYSWERSAGEYVRLYKKTLAN